MVDESIGVVSFASCADEKKVRGQFERSPVVGELSQPEPHVNPGPKVPPATLLQTDSPGPRDKPISTLSMQKRSGDLMLLGVLFIPCSNST